MSIILFPRTSLIARSELKEGRERTIWSEIVCTNISVRTRTSAFILIHHLIQLRTREKFFPSIALLRCCGHRSIKFPRWECWFFGWFCYARKERRKFLLGTHELLLENTRWRLFNSKTESDRASILEVVLAAPTTHHRKRESV